MILLQIVFDVANHGHKALSFETPGSNAARPFRFLFAHFSILMAANVIQYSAN
jgi:hypothetical protein